MATWEVTERRRHSSASARSMPPRRLFPHGPALPLASPPARFLHSAAPPTAKLLQWPRMGQRGLTWQPLVKGGSRHSAEPPARNNAPGPFPSLARDDARSEAGRANPRPYAAGVPAGAGGGPSKHPCSHDCRILRWLDRPTYLAESPALSMVASINCPISMHYRDRPHARGANTPRGGRNPHQTLAFGVTRPYQFGEL